MCPTQSSSPSARFVNWPQVEMSSTDSGSNEHSFTYVCMSTVDDLSYTPSAEERTRDAAQIAATGRRSWKTLKGKGEAVWPPHLEAALIEALEKYQPDDSRSTKLFGRFPLRNRFISNYIFETTGKRRTPKQVGSRLQQLRDTCKGKRLLDLISNRTTSPTDCDPPISSPSPSSDNSIQATSPPPFRSHPQARRTFIYVDILPEPLPWPSPFPIIRFTESGSNPLTIRFTSPPPDQDSSADPDLNNGVQSSSSSSHDPPNPVVTFASPSILHPQASFSVFLLGESSPVHSEVVPLICCASPLQGCEWTYSTTLVPGYWNTLCTCPDPSRYTIVQDIIAIQSGSPDAGSIYPKPSTGDTNDNGTTFSVVFRFSHSNATPAPLVAPHILQRPSDVDLVLSPTNTESSTTSPFTPSSSSSSLLPTTHRSIDVQRPLELPQDIWSPVVPYSPFLEPYGSRYFDTMFSSCPEDYSSLAVPMISRTSRHSATTSDYLFNNHLSQRFVDNSCSGIQPWSSLAAPFPIYPSNYVL